MRGHVRSCIKVEEKTSIIRSLVEALERIHSENLEEKREYMALRRIVRRQLLWLGGVIVLVGMLLPNTVAARSPSPLDPASPNAALIANLYWIVFWMSVAVFILVEAC